MEEITLETILTALGELKELTENNNICNFTEKDSENLGSISNEVFEINDQISKHLENIDKHTEQIEIYLDDIYTMTDNMEKIAEHAFFLCLALITITILIKTFFTGW